MQVPSCDATVLTSYSAVPAIYPQQTRPQEGEFPCFGASGTGGVESVEFYVRQVRGYFPFGIVLLRATPEQGTNDTSTNLMKTVKAGFGRTMSYLPVVFGVSRQTLYNWLNGEKEPKTQHQAKLVQLAAAARVFSEERFKPTAQSLERSIGKGQSFLDLVGQGADGKEAAELLVRIERHGRAAREKLGAMLGEREVPGLSASRFHALTEDI
jgi:transcriptional regulator with XRE-family HTH domain